MGSGYFRFKHFTVHQDDKVLKVSTDSVLLASFTDKTLNPAKILDIGAGTGLLSLAMASFFKSAKIDAVEIDPHSFEFLKKNISFSQYSSRITPYLQDIKDFAGKEYDIIITNPPFFSDMPPPASSHKNLFKHTSCMSVAELAFVISRKLNNIGKLYIILAAGTFGKFSEVAAKHGLFPSRRLNIRWTPGKKIERIVAEFSHEPIITPPSETLCVYNEHRQPSPEYIKLTSEMYLETHFEKKRK